VGSTGVKVLPPSVERQTPERKPLPALEYWLATNTTGVPEETPGWMVTAPM